MTLSDRRGDVVVVTGASAGLGRAIADRFARNGSRLAIIARGKERLEAESVDALQADATRCCGISEFMRVGALCDSYGIPLSAHTAPALHLHPGCAINGIRHVEYFHDHVRIERRSM